MTINKVPVLDLHRQYDLIGDDLEKRVLEVLRSGHYILGQNLLKLEEGVAEISGCAHGIGVANGTDALILSLRVFGIGPGDEVITTSFTFAATAEAIVLVGAKPVFVDIDRETFNIDPELLEAAITPRTKAIIPVHLYGQPADMDRILAVARRHGLKVIEDNAQAIGALYKGRPTGGLGDVAAISFYPTKNLGACGDAGMLVTNCETTAEHLRSLRAHGMRVRYYHDEIGVNSRLDELQAVALLTKLPHLNKWNEQRRQLASIYSESLAGCTGIVPPVVSRDVTPVWHQYTIRLQGRRSDLRDTVQKELATRGIGSMCYYPVPLHLQAAFSDLGYKRGSLPITEAAADQVLSLPMYPELTGAEVKHVADAVVEIVQSIITVNMPSPAPREAVQPDEATVRV